MNFCSNCGGQYMSYMHIQGPRPMMDLTELCRVVCSDCGEWVGTWNGKEFNATQSVKEIHEAWQREHLK